MIVRSLEDVLGTDSEVETPSWTSRRLLLKRDGMGFSLHDTIVRPGHDIEMWYKNHLEAVYCIEGDGEIRTLADGRIHQIRPGTVYALDRHDHHVLRARTPMRLVCVFNPAVTGTEVHGDDLAYPLVDD